MSLKSLGIFVGTGQCNGNCSFCAGRMHRKYAPKEDKPDVETMVRVVKTLRDCYAQGARNLSLSGSGEPTLSPLSVTKVLQLACSLLISDRIKYAPINLYSNGIRIGTDEDFCNEYLTYWHHLGLDTIYLTVHDAHAESNAKVYGIDSYPELQTIVDRIHEAGIKVRANLILGKQCINTAEQFKNIVSILRYKKFDSIAAWPIRNEQDEIDETLSPPKAEMDIMRKWATNDCVFPFCPVRFPSESREDYKSGDKLTLFPDGTLSSSWCK